MATHEKRRTPRVPLPGKIKVETVRGTYTAFGRDLSEGGMGIYLPKLPPTGSPVTVRFKLPGSDQMIEITAEVKYHSRGKPGISDDWIGIKFLRMDSVCQMSIHTFVKKNYDSSNPLPPAPPPPGKKPV